MFFSESTGLMSDKSALLDVVCSVECTGLSELRTQSALLGVVCSVECIGLSELRPCWVWSVL